MTDLSGGLFGIFFSWERKIFFCWICLGSCEFGVLEVSFFIMWGEFICRMKLYIEGSKVERWRDGDRER